MDLLATASIHLREQQQHQKLSSFSTKNAIKFCSLKHFISSNILLQSSSVSGSSPIKWALWVFIWNHMSFLGGRLFGLGAWKLQNKNSKKCKTPHKIPFKNDHKILLLFLFGLAPSFILALNWTWALIRNPFFKTGCLLELGA